MRHTRRISKVIRTLQRPLAAIEIGISIILLVLVSSPMYAMTVSIKEGLFIQSIPSPADTLTAEQIKLMRAIDDAMFLRRKAQTITNLKKAFDRDTENLGYKTKSKAEQKVRHGQFQSLMADVEKNFTRQYNKMLEDRASGKDIEMVQSQDRMEFLRRLAEYRHLVKNKY